MIDLGQPCVKVIIPNITYLDRPAEPIYAFLLEVAKGEIGDHWGGGWVGNDLVEYEREILAESATEWADDQGLEAQQRAQLLQWIDGLPWSGDVVMLHLNW